MNFLHNLIPVQSLANCARLDILTFMFAVAVLTIAVVLLSAGLGSIIGTIIHRINNLSPVGEQTPRRRGLVIWIRGPRPSMYGVENLQIRPPH